MLPQHVAIIMDGNGRWASGRDMSRLAGHKAGAEALRATIKRAGELKIPTISIYAFSTENWGRPKDEVLGIIRMFMQMIQSERAQFLENKVRFSLCGRRTGIPPDLLSQIETLENDTKAFRDFRLVVCFNYGGRDEIVYAASNVFKDILRRSSSLEEARLAAENITDVDLSASMFLPDVTTPDLVIRTGGEVRVSNFLLWEIAYSELLFLPVLWPDFTVEMFDSCIEDYKTRKRRFGRV